MSIGSLKRRPIDVSGETKRWAPSDDGLTTGGGGSMMSMDALLARGFRPKLKGWGRPFSRFAAAGMTKTGHIPAQEKLEQLRDLGAHIYVCGGSLDHFKVSREDFIYDDFEVVEYLTFMSVMEDADIHIYI